MYNISETEDYNLIHKILSEPHLAKVSAFDGTVDISFQYLLIRLDEKVIGCFCNKPFTSQVLECHINILPEFWGKNHALEASSAGFDWVKNNTSYTKCFTDVPVVCKHVHELCKKIGWNPCGLIRKG